MNKEYYDELAIYYRLIYPDWDASVQRQAKVLNGIILEHQTRQPITLLDAACGIGTQCIGFAELGYQVAASDISGEEVSLAEKEAQKRGLKINFHVNDMCKIWDSMHRQYDVVIALDNAIPHLLTDTDILHTFKQFYECTNNGGLCLISVRDYEKMERTDGFCLHPRLVHVIENGQIVLCDVWKFEGQYYEMTTYVINDHGGKTANTRVIRGGKYYCVGLSTLVSLMEEAGFSEVTVIRDRFFQPLLLAKKQQPSY